jgi:hypothetical protein
VSDALAIATMVYIWMALDEISGRRQTDEDDVLYSRYPMELDQSPQRSKGVYRNTLNRLVRHRHHPREVRRPVFLERPNEMVIVLLLLLLLLMMMMIIYGAHARQVSCVIWGFVALDCPLPAQVAKNSLWNDMLP